MWNFFLSGYNFTLALLVMLSPNIKSGWEWGLAISTAIRMQPETI